MIVIEYMENGSLDAFLRVSVTFQAQEVQSSILFPNFLCIGWKVSQTAGRLQQDLGST